MVATWRVIGLMSGTSMDGIDAALIETDGTRVLSTGAGRTHPYSPETRRCIKAALGARERSEEIDALEVEITDAHAAAVRELMAGAGLSSGDIDLVGFHGQTITHAPDEGWTWQLGDGERLARSTGIPTVFDFRSADMAAGGQGAPLAPVYHRALAQGQDMPLGFLNLGGVANLTYIESADAPPIGFDTGPANAPLDDLLHNRTGASMDEGGFIASNGTVREDVLDELMSSPFFGLPYPKSLDRNAFDLTPVEDLSLEDAAATLAAFCAQAVVCGVDALPRKPDRWLVCGGGRHNETVMNELRSRLGVAVEPVEAIGVDGDMLEAQAFGFMAARHMEGLPFTFPETTGASESIVGGRRSEAVTLP